MKQEADKYTADLLAPEGSKSPTVKPGMHVRTRSGLVFKVQKASKHGVLTLVNACGGFAMFSHVAVVEVVQA